MKLTGVLLVQTDMINSPNRSTAQTDDFFNSLISQSFVPYIHQPTGVTDHSATVIDNIFSNITDHETVSRNITSLIADHFAQFFLIKTCRVSSNLQLFCI